MARQHFAVTFRVASDRDGIHALRALLKIAGRHLHLRAVDVRETTPFAVAALGGTVQAKQRPGENENGHA